MVFSWNCRLAYLSLCFLMHVSLLHHCFLHSDFALLKEYVNLFSSFDSWLFNLIFFCICFCSKWMLLLLLCACVSHMYVVCMLDFLRTPYCLKNLLVLAMIDKLILLDELANFFNSYFLFFHF